jgi:hypothetical protein
LSFAKNRSGSAIGWRYRAKKPQLAGRQTWFSFSFLKPKIGLLSC